MPSLPLELADLLPSLLVLASLDIEMVIMAIK
jgi:hypothetical protein